MGFAAFVASLAVFCMVCAGNPTTSVESDESPLLWLLDLFGCAKKEFGYRLGVHNFDSLLARNSEQYQSKCRALGVELTDFTWVNNHNDHELVLQQTDDWMTAMFREVKSCPVMLNTKFRMTLFVTSASSAAAAGADFWVAVYGMLLDKEMDTATTLVFPQFQDDFARFDLFLDQLYAELWEITRRVRRLTVVHPQFQFNPNNPADDTEKLEDPRIAEPSYVFTHRGPYPAIVLVHSKNPAGQPWLSGTVSAESHDMRVHWKAETSKKLKSIGVHWLQAMLDAKNWTALPKLLEIVGEGAM